METILNGYDIESPFCKMDISTSQLLALSKELPSMVIKDIRYAKAIKLMEKVGQPDIFEFRENND